MKKCVYCGCREPLYLNIDHKVPKCKGGTDQQKNLQHTCILCNQIKNGYSEEKFLKMMKSLRQLKEDKIVTFYAKHKISFNEK